MLPPWHGVVVVSRGSPPPQARPMRGRLTISLSAICSAPWVRVARHLKCFLPRARALPLFPYRDTAPPQCSTVPRVDQHGGCGLYQL
eukprot:1482386-Amphidinium_carterae.1